MPAPTRSLVPPITSNDRVPSDVFYLVSGPSIVEHNYTDGTTRKLAGTEAARVKRWILREEKGR